jgi:hypothetical protein
MSQRVVIFALTVQVVLFFLTNFLILRHLKATQFVIWHQKSMRHAGTPSIRNLI